MLVRSGRSSIPALRRSLGAAGIPVEVAGDDTPLVREPAVTPLLEALRAVVHLDAGAGDEDRLDPESAEALLVSPLAGTRRGRAPDVRPGAPRAREGLGRVASPVRRPAQGRVARSWLARRCQLRGLAQGACAGRPAGVGASEARRGRHRRGGALGAVVGHRLATTAPRRRRVGRPACPARPPRPGRDLCAVRHRRPGRGAPRTHRCRRLRRDARRPADPGRHPRRPGRARFVGAAADRAPLEGTGVAPRRGGTRAGAGLARPSPSHHAAAGRPDRRGGAAATGQHPRPARRGAPAVLRRGHPRA